MHKKWEECPFYNLCIITVKKYCNLSMSLDITNRFINNPILKLGKTVWSEVQVPKL